VRNGDFVYEDAAWMRAAYLDRGMTLRQIATEARCSLRTVARWMAIHEIPRRENLEAQLLAVRRGPDSPFWKAAAICEGCGGRRAYTAKSCSKCRDRSGERNPKWRGDDIDYPAAHDRVKKRLGSATGYDCRHCTDRAKEWAYDHGDPGEKFDPDNGPYSLDVNRYLSLCVKCHRRFDADYARQRRSACGDLDRAGNGAATGRR
jgi:hypothetical protein